MPYEFQWEFNLIADSTVNAFCLPGGKVAFYEGIMPVCQDEAGLAVVISHEIAHALARHGGEQMSHQMVSDGMSTVVNHVTRKQDEYNQKLIQKLNFSTTVTENPFLFPILHQRHHKVSSNVPHVTTNLSTA